MSDNELGLGDSDITRAASKLKTELGKAAKKNEDIRKMVRKNRDVRSIQERFKNASDFVKSEIEDFVNIDYQEPEEEVRKWEPPVPLTRKLIHSTTKPTKLPVCPGKTQTWVFAGHICHF